MPIPNAEHAIIPEAKVRDYLLNPSHPAGGPKTVWFGSVGYALDNWQDLAHDLLKLARTSDAFIAKRSPFGGSGGRLAETETPNATPSPAATG